MSPGKLRTKRKNAQKREKRRALAAVRAAICKSDLESGGVKWTREAEELELMRNEEERQRVHQTWLRAVERADAAFQRQQQILAERQRLIQAIRQSMAE